MDTQNRTVPVIIRLYYENDWFGKLICWRLESKYSHSTIEIDDTIYSATYPTVMGVSTSDIHNPKYDDVAMPPRKGASYTIMLTPQEAEAAKAYCVGKIGSSYDVLSALGWALRIGSLQTRKHVYCFEYVYAALAHAGLFPKSKALITGDQLLNELYRTGHLAHLDPVVVKLAMLQRPPK